MQQAMEYIDYTDQVQVDYSHLQKSKLKFKKGQRAKSVYHYTSIGGLESILRNKTLRFTNIASVDKGIHNKTTKYGLPTY